MGPPGAYGGPPPMGGGYGAPPPMQGYGGPPPQAGFGGPPPQGPPGGGGGGDGQFMYEGKFVRGTINWFDANKNFGFLRTEFGGEDMFLHGNDLSPAVYGSCVEYFLDARREAALPRRASRGTSSSARVDTARHRFPIVAGDAVVFASLSVGSEDRSINGDETQNENASRENARKNARRRRRRRVDRRGGVRERTLFPVSRVAGTERAARRVLHRAFLPNRVWQTVRVSFYFRY